MYRYELDGWPVFWNRCNCKHKLRKWNEPSVLTFSGHRIYVRGSAFILAAFGKKWKRFVEYGERNGITDKMVVRLRRSIIIGGSIFVILTTIILIAEIHNDIRFASDYLLTPKFNLATNFQPNAVEDQPKLGFK